MSLQQIRFLKDQYEETAKFVEKINDSASKSLSQLKE